MAHDLSLAVLAADLQSLGIPVDWDKVDSINPRSSVTGTVTLEATGFEHCETRSKTIKFNGCSAKEALFLMKEMVREYEAMYMSEMAVLLKDH